MTDPKFIVVRYASGCAGKFLSVMLQLSNDIASWDKKLENIKRTTQFKDKLIEYLNEHFPSDPSQHLRIEPDLPYYTDFYSGTFERGNETTYQEFCRYQEDNNVDYFKKNINHNKKINLILHKSQIPKFMEGALFVNVIINSTRSLSWSRKMLWLKHYEVIDANTVKRKHHDPNTCNAKRSHLVIKYFTGSPLVKVNTVEEFFDQEIVNNPEFTLFSTVENILEHKSNNQVTQDIFYLDNLFSAELTVKNISDIFINNGLSVPDNNLMFETYNFWWSRQNAILNHWNLTCE